jgi:hypothetical protein
MASGMHPIALDGDSAPTAFALAILPHGPWRMAFSHLRGGSIVEPVVHKLIPGPKEEVEAVSACALAMATSAN